jgi:hypothetical protein
MFYRLLQFECYYFSRKPLVYLSAAVFFAAGLLLGKSEGAGFPNIHFNSPYQISYLVGILSLGTIFSSTLVVAERRVGLTKSSTPALYLKANTCLSGCSPWRGLAYSVFLFACPVLPLVMS